MNPMVRYGLCLALGSVLGCKDNAATTSPDLATNGGQDGSMSGGGVMTFNLVTAAGAANHFPGADGVIGTSDDLVSGSSSAMNMSAPNSMNTYSFQALDFGSHATDNGF